MNKEFYEETYSEWLRTKRKISRCEDFIVNLQCECTKVMNSLEHTIVKSLELEFARAKLLKLFFEIIYQAITETDNELVRQIDLYRLACNTVYTAGMDSEYFSIFEAALEVKETNIIADTIRYILSSETLEDIAKKQVVIRELFEQ